MAIYDKFADTPRRLVLEGQDISVNLIRNGDGTATIEWNLPRLGSEKLEDLIYDGIVITVSNKPADFISTSPKNGTYYEADPTFDVDLHSGDKISIARVVGAFYHDRETTSLTVTDVKDKTPYYVSAYAVDQVGNYHREGVHAYSLATMRDEELKTTDEKPAFHDFQVDTPKGVSLKTKTGLDTATQYNLKITVNGDCHEFTDLLGSNMQTYEDMASTINHRFKMLADPLLGPLFPNEGKYQVDLENNKVFLWDGEKNIEQTSIFLDADPTTPVLDTYWYKSSTQELRVRETDDWVLVSNIIKFPTDPSDPEDNAIWFNKMLTSAGELDTVNSIAWRWENGTWCKLPTIIQTRSPLLAPLLTSGDYWYDENNGTVFKFNPETKKWDEVDPIVWDADPDTISDEDYWYNSTSELVFVRNNSGNWNELNNIRFAERNSDDDLDHPVANHYWFIPSEQRLFQRDAANTIWNEINVIISAFDPVDRESCNLWWNDDTDVLKIWDAVNNTWNEVNSFTLSETDPNTPATLKDNTIWYNPETEIMQKITGTNCVDVSFIESKYDPVNPPVGVVWEDTDDEKWFIWDGASFVEIDVTISENDPYEVSEGVFWYDLVNNDLFNRESGSWVETEFSTESLAPDKNTFFYDTINDKLLQWNGNIWEESCGVAEVELKFNREVCFNDLPDVNTDLFSPFNDFDKYGRDIIRFKTCEVGCDQRIEVDNFSTVLTKLNKPIIRFSPATGRSENEGGPTYREIGAGDDGTPDERRRLQDQIRVAMGSLGVQVELTKQQLDECIDNALLMIRKYSSYAYEHVLFFMDVFPNQQKYLLTDKCVGFNKVIAIHACHRMRTGFLGASHGTFGGYDIFGYAALQQLYTLGTFDMLSYHMVSSYLEDLQYLFADQLVYTFYEDTRVLDFHQIFYNYEKLLLDAYIEVPEQKIFNNRYVSLWLKKWAISEAKMILSQVRGKYQSLPGPNGSTVLNSQELITQAENEKAELREELFDRSMQDHNADVMSQFYIG